MTYPELTYFSEKLVAQKKAEIQAHKEAMQKAKAAAKRK